MNLDELRSIRERERNTDSLQHLEEAFYEDVGRYIADLKAERERVAEQADDPWSNPEIQQLSDEIDTAEEIAEAIYERRMGKLVKEASLAAAGYATDAEGLTLEEERLFEDLVGRIETNKASVLDVLSGETTEESESEPEPDAVGDTAEAETAGVEEQAAPPAQSDTAEPTPAEPASADPATPGRSEPDPETTGEGDAAGIDAASVMDPTPDGDDTPIEKALDSDTESGGPSPTTDTDDELADDPLVADGAAEAQDAAAAPPETEQSPPEADEPAASAAEPSDETAAAADEDSDSEAVNRKTVRITSDIGEILGLDEHEYHLTADDVVTLPEENATPLIERDAAEPLE